MSDRTLTVLLDTIPALGRLRNLGSRVRRRVNSAVRVNCVEKRGGRFDDLRDDAEVQAGSGVLMFIGLDGKSSIEATWPCVPDT